jgi:hypothetical protein
MMHPGGNPFEPHPADPFAGQRVSGYGPPVTGQFGYGPPSGPPFGQAPNQETNTFAVLSPIFAVIVPPVGVALGHLALPQIERTGERGKPAAIAGLVIGYLMCLVLIAAGIWWATSDSDDGKTSTTASTTTTLRAPTFTRPPRPTTVTSVAPPTAAPRVKVDLATVPLGTCVNVQLRSSEGDDQLDLFKVNCEHAEGVYTVDARVPNGSECRSVYVAAPPDRSFALCLNPY